MEVEAALPPVEVRFKKLYNSYSLRILKFNKNHLVKQYLVVKVWTNGLHISVQAIDKTI
jgi:hypothetical protein